MKTAVKRTLVIVLSLALMIGLLPGLTPPVYAAADYTFVAGTDQSGTGWSWDGTNNTLTLSGASIGGIIIEPDATIVLTDGTTNTISGSGVNYALYAKGALTIQGNGSLTVTNARVNNNSIAIYAAKDLTITGGTITATGGGSNNPSVESTGILSGGNLTISGGTVTARGNAQDNKTNGRSFGIRIASGMNTTISGDNTVVNAYSGDAVQHSFAIANGGANPDGTGTGGIMTITGGTINAVGGNSDNNPAEGIFVRSGGRLVLQGGHVTVSSGNAAKNNSYAFRSMGTLEISGGVLEATSGHSGGTDIYSRSFAIYANEKVIITGGMIAASADNTSSSCSAIQADGGIEMDTTGGNLSVYNAEDLASFASGTTKSLIQETYSKPLRIGAVQYIISAENDGRGTATVEGGASTGMTPAGTGLTVAATPSANYEFNYWTVNDVKSNTLTSATAIYTVNKTDGDAVVKAFFKPAAALTDVDISGDTSVGSTLSSSVTPDGALEVTYQWYRDDVAIEGETNPTYTITDNDKGTTLKVVATQYGTEASVNDTISIPDGSTPAPEATPAAIITATGPDSGTLEGLTPGADYTITLPDNSTKNVTADGVGKCTIDSGLTAGSIEIVKKGDGTTTTDSGAQTIAITKAAAPNASATDCTTSANDDGTLTGVTAAMEYRKSDDNTWTDGTGSDITGLVPGTYYVRVKATGTALASDNQELTVSAFTPAPDTQYVSQESEGETITVPVSGDDESVNVTVRVSGNTATITGADVEKVLEAEQVGTVTIDVSVLRESTSAVVIPSGLLKKISDAVADENNTADSLEIKLPTGSVVFDKAAVAAIADQAAGNDLKLNLDNIGVQGLNSEQLKAIEDLNVAAVYDAYMTSNGKRISDFRGGTATVTVTYELKDGEFVSGIRVWYVADGGDRSGVPTSFEGRLIHFVVAHFSNYVVSYDQNAVTGSATGCPKDATCPISKYTDSKTTAWYHDGVHFVLENGIMVGYGSGIFRPDTPITRAEIVQTLYNLEGKPAAAGTESFADVAEGAWYCDAVNWACGAGIIEGYGDGNFGPKDTLTREQMAAIIYRHAKTKGQGFTGAWMFLLENPDASEISSWADEAMHWMVMNGLVQGREGGMLVPQGEGARAEIATIMMRYCQL